MTFCMVLLVLTPLAQAPAARPPAPPTASESDAGAIALGWNAVASGRYDEGSQAAERVLQSHPWDLAAMVLKLHALSAASSARGLEAYERWLTRGHADDAALIEPVALAVVREIAAGARLELHAPALRALMAARVPGAREALLAAHPVDAPQPAFDAEAARAGDAGALQRLNRQAAAGGSPAIASALADVGAPGEPGLLLLTHSPDPQTRAAAIEALGAVKSEPAREAARALGHDPDPVVRMSSTVALAQMGDARALSDVERMLGSNVPDLQIAASRAWEGRPGPWVATIRPLLENQDGLTRLEAARAIAPQDPDAARQTLTAALADPNPAVRYQSARVLSETALPMDARDLVTLRLGLRDPDPAVRLAVAAVLLRVARGTAEPRR